MGVRLLGALEVTGDRGDLVPLGKPKQRTVCALLLTREGRLVTLGEIIDELWGTRPPASAVANARGYVAGLRRVFSAGSRCGVRIESHGSGYVSHVEDGHLDLRSYADLVSEGRDAMRRGDAAAAVDRWGEALALFAGEPLEGLPGGSALDAWRQAMREDRAVVLEEWAQAQSSLGGQRVILADLREHVLRYPLRERGWELLIDALHHENDVPSALAAFSTARALFIAELGIEPGPGLVARQRALLSGEAPIRQTWPPRPAQLPRAAPDFVGRQQYLKQLMEIFSGGSAIAVILGGAGVGKTSLALAWAHSVSSKFPDGHLFADFTGQEHGDPAQALKAVPEVLAGFLRALGVTPERIPAQLEECAALYRTITADRRLLVLLDNVGTAEQVRPLLPAGDGCAVLVTSRESLPGLVLRAGARPISLAALDEHESRELFARVVGQRPVRDQVAIFDELAELCCHLPLALRLAAAQVVARSPAEVAGFASRLRGGDRLTTLADGADPACAVRTAFDESYERLATTQRRLFCFAGALPGKDFTAESLASALDLPIDQAASGLGRLASVHLVEPVAAGRFRMHELLREYAIARFEAECTSTERESALRRLLSHYEKQARATQNGWFERERENVVMAAIAAQRIPSARRFGQSLVDALFPYLSTGRYLAQWRVTGEAVLAHAEPGDSRGRAIGHLSLTASALYSGQYRQSLSHARTALGHCHRSGWSLGQVFSLWYQGLAHTDLGDCVAAADCLHQALMLTRGPNTAGSRPMLLSALGSAYYYSGNVSAAITRLRQAISWQQRTRTPFGVARSLYFLAATDFISGRLDEAHRHATECLTLAEFQGRIDLRSGCLATLADIASLTVNAGRAPQLAEKAYELALEIGDRFAQANALNSLAAIHLRQAKPQETLGYGARALKVAKDIGSGYAANASLILTARARLDTGHTDAAWADAIAAERASRTAGQQLLLGQALSTLAHCALASGSVREAETHARQAFRIHSEYGHRLGIAEVRALLFRIR